MELMVKVVPLFEYVDEEISWEWNDINASDIQNKFIELRLKEEKIIKNDVHDNNVASEKKVRSAKERLLEAKELLDLGLISKEDYDKIKLEIMKNI